MVSGARPAPPRAPITFRVGVVGHRPDRLPQDPAGLMALQDRLGLVLRAVADSVAAFSDSPDAAFYQSGTAPVLRANSPLAEGADRMFATEALALGYHLTCIMPFAQSEFERDFESPHGIGPQSRDDFRAILARAESHCGLTRFELDGRRSHPEEAYEAAGRVVLNQSDLLVVVWDGGAARGGGGTLDTLRQAIEFHVPALWIDSRTPHGWRLLREIEDLDCLDDDGLCVTTPRSQSEDEDHLRAAVSLVVRAELALPQDETLGEHARRNLGDYLCEHKARLNLAFLWKLFRDFVDRGTVKPPQLVTPDFVSQIRADWPVRGDATLPAPSASASWINGRLREHYAWADKLADHYADDHRSGFIWSSLLAATAVFTALLPVAGHFSPHASVATGIFEAFILCVMVGLPMVARRRRWHQRWLEYRVLAELIRELRILIPLGGARPLPRTALHLSSYGDPAHTWMYWQARAVARATGLPQVTVTSAYVQEQVAALQDFVGSPEGPAWGQLRFHMLNAERMERIHRRLHQVSVVLFSITLAAVAVDWGARVLTPTVADRVIEWLIVVAAGFPALGAALASINNQGEFARLQRRSHAMVSAFETMRHRIAEMAAQHPQSITHLANLAAQIATMMIDEVTDWRIVVLDLPHVAG